MTDYQGALEQAIYERLAARVSKARVFQHVPENTPPPVVIIGDVDFEDDGGKDGVLLRFSVQVVSIVAGSARKPLNTLQAEVFDALNDWTPTATAAVCFGAVRVTTGTGQEVQAAQAPVYFGQQTAVCYVQAA